MHQHYPGHTFLSFTPHIQLLIDFCPFSLLNISQLFPPFYRSSLGWSHHQPFLCNSDKQPLNHTHSSPPPIESSHRAKMAFKTWNFITSLPCLQAVLPRGTIVLKKQCEVFIPEHRILHRPGVTSFPVSLLLTSTLTFLVSEMRQSSCPLPLDLMDALPSLWNRPPSASPYLAHPTCAQIKYMASCPGPG